MWLVLLYFLFDVVKCCEWVVIVFGVLLGGDV